MGALEWGKVVHEHQGWRLVTCMWLHAGILHLLTNMLSLIFIGIRLEQQFGFSKFFCLNALSSKLRHFNLWLTCSKSRAYLLNLWSRWKHTLLSFPSRKYLRWCFWCSLWTSWSYVVWTSHQLDYLCQQGTYYPLNRLRPEMYFSFGFYRFCTFFLQAAALFTLLFIIAINLGLGLLPRVDNFAHIGGFITGFCLGFILLVRPQHGWESSRTNASLTKRKYSIYQYVLFIVAVLLLVVCLTVGSVMLFKGENGNKHCKWCHRLSCFPTSKWTC